MTSQAKEVAAEVCRVRARYCLRRVSGAQRREDYDGAEYWLTRSSEALACMKAIRMARPKKRETR